MCFEKLHTVCFLYGAKHLNGPVFQNDLKMFLKIGEAGIGAPFRFSIFRNDVADFVKLLWSMVGFLDDQVIFI